MQQVQPASSMEHMQSQQAWIIAQQALSPLVQVTHTPLGVISHLHMPMVRLQQQTIMPFINMQQLHMPPARALQRFCTIWQAIGSSQTQVIFMPPAHFSILKVQRGTMDMVGAGDMPAAGIPIPGAGAMLMRSIIIVLLAMLETPFQKMCGSPPEGGNDSIGGKAYPKAPGYESPFFRRSLTETTCCKRHNLGALWIPG